MAHSLQHWTPELRAGVVARASQVGITLAVQAGLLFLTAGNLRWFWAWLLLGVYLIVIGINSILLLRTSPETIAERGHAGPGVKRWDELIGGAWAVTYYLLLVVVAGLDQRFGWTGSLPDGVHLAGAALFAGGLALFSWAMVVNAYFSTMVRIQTERGQVVCQRGPYRVVRHPGYVGAIVQSVGAPLLLGSLPALVPGILAALLMVARTVLEDRTLQIELPGYPDYARRVRYRLLPGVW